MAELPSVPPLLSIPSKRVLERALAVLSLPRAATITSDTRTRAGCTFTALSRYNNFLTLNTLYFDTTWVPRRRRDVNPPTPPHPEESNLRKLYVIPPTSRCITFTSGSSVLAILTKVSISDKILRQTNPTVSLKPSFETLIS